MTELLTRILTRVLTAAMVPLTGWLTAHNLITSDEAVKVVAEIVAWTIAIGGSIVGAVRARQHQLTAQALASPASTAQVKALVNSGAAPPVTTPANEVPTLQPATSGTSRGMGLGAGVVVLALVGASLSAGCAGARWQLPKTPDAIRADAKQIAVETKEILTYAREVRRIAESMTDAGVIPGATMDSIDRAAIALGKATDAALARLPDIATAAGLLAESQTLTDAVDRLFDALRSARIDRLNKWVDRMDLVWTTARLFSAPTPALQEAA